MINTSKNERILLVDDDPQVVRVQRMILERRGYCVTGFTSSEQALSAFYQDPHGFDLVLSDFRMPGITGDRLAREIASARPDIPIILCTSHGQHALEKIPGIAGVLVKPISIHKLAKNVEKALVKAGK